MDITQHLEALETAMEAMEKMEHISELQVQQEEAEARKEEAKLLQLQEKNKIVTIEQDGTKFTGTQDEVMGTIERLQKMTDVIERKKQGLFS